jgi:hypothetical protein
VLIAKQRKRKYSTALLRNGSPFRDFPILPASLWAGASTLSRRWFPEGLFAQGLNPRGKGVHRLPLLR